MYKEYDLFERFPDGSSLWRASVLGLKSTRLHLLELARKSENHFYAINLASGRIVRAGLGRVDRYFQQHQEVGRQSKPATA